MTIVWSARQLPPMQPGEGRDAPPVIGIALRNTASKAGGRINEKGPTHLLSEAIAP
jgi:hypothetical protein